MRGSSGLIGKRQGNLRKHTAPPPGSARKLPRLRTRGRGGRATARPVTPESRLARARLRRHAIPPPRPGFRSRMAPGLAALRLLLLLGPAARTQAIEQTAVG